MIGERRGGGPPRQQSPPSGGGRPPRPPPNRGGAFFASRQGRRPRGGRGGGGPAGKPRRWTGGPQAAPLAIHGWRLLRVLEQDDARGEAVDEVFAADGA